MDPKPGGVTEPTHLQESAQLAMGSEALGREGQKICNSGRTWTCEVKASSFGAQEWVRRLLGRVWEGGS